MAYNDVVFWSKQQLELHGPANAEILAFGDSWFHYPPYGGSLINTIGDLVKPTGRKILVSGANGAEIRAFASGDFHKRCMEMFRLYGKSCKAVLVSGGGNDFAGFNDLRPLLEPDCSKAKTAAECFRPGDAYTEDTLPWLQSQVYRAYAVIFYEIMEGIPGNTKFFVHNYDYAPVTGKGFMGGQGWIKPALDDAKVPVHLHADCVKLIIDSQSDTLMRLKNALPDRIVFIDGRNTLNASHWANELHPNHQGFKKLVLERWQQPLIDNGLAI